MVKVFFIIKMFTHFKEFGKTANLKVMVFKNSTNKVQIILEALYRVLNRATVLIHGITAVANIMENSIEA